MNVKIGQIIDIISPYEIYIVDENNNSLTLKLAHKINASLGEYIVYWNLENKYEIWKLNDVI